MFRDMSEILAPAEKGDFRIQHFEVTEKDIRAMIDGILPGRYVKLTYNGQIVMSNTWMEERTNFEFCRNAHGDVLIGGLGIGMIVLAIQEKEAVKSITILEKFQDVIDLVAGQLPLNSKVKIIKADVFDWKPEKGKRFDCIYMDIWNYINSDIYNDEMKPLKRKWAHFLKPLAESPNRFNKCWAEWYAKHNMRL